MAHEHDPGPEANSEEEGPITSAERLLYALGQLLRHSRSGQLPVAPENFDVWDLAGILGVRPAIEFVSETPSGERFHFADEVLAVDRGEEFPWRLLTTSEWVAEQEALAALGEEDEE